MNTRTHAHTHTHARTHARTYTHVCNINIHISLLVSVYDCWYAVIAFGIICLSSIALTNSWYYFEHDNSNMIVCVHITVFDLHIAARYNSMNRCRQGHSHLYISVLESDDIHLEPITTSNNNQQQLIRQDRLRSQPFTTFLCQYE